LLIVFAVVVAAAVAAVVLLTRSGNEKAAETGTALSWKQDPRIYGLATLPRDRVAVGRVVNTGPDALTLSAGDFEIRDRQGRDLDSRAQFIDTRHPPPGSLGLGTDVELEPEGVSPLTLAYRLEPRVDEPLTVFFEGEPALPLPGGPVRDQPVLETGPEPAS
jgi:hypothetical protein